MFVLKSLIDKYISSKGGKLWYSSFVDFHKAFDTVIHPGLNVKLEELNINGKIYDILCDFYPASILRKSTSGRHRLPWRADDGPI